MSVNNEISTPKNPSSNTLATSTVMKQKSLKRIPFDSSTANIEPSMSILNLTDIDLSHIVETSGKGKTVDAILNMRREQANDTLSRASRVSAIPSFLLKPDLVKGNNTSLPFQCESTISESDLLQTRNNTSTPRTSSNENDLMSQAPGSARESIFSKFRSILDTDISTQNALEEFKQISEANKKEANVTMDSGLFTPGELAKSRLMADERSWRQKHEMPVVQKPDSFCDTRLPSMSIGEFFQKGSDNISELGAESPEKFQPVALIDSSLAPSIVDESNQLPEQSSYQSSDSLSVSAIQKLLSDGSQNNIIDYLLKQNRKPAKKNTDLGESSDVFSLPVSRDVSYTSSFSDNEAIRVAATHESEQRSDEIKDKENVRPTSQTIVVKPQRKSLPNDQQPVASQSRSSSSLSSLPNGKLPIDSTVTELVWGCVKVDRSVTKQFLLRNKTPKTLRLQCSVSSYEFKIRKDNRSDSDHLTACKFVLHGHESRPLIISFTPTKIGAAVDELVFTPLDSDLKQSKKQCVRLWGYGGYICTEYHNVSRDNTGKYWMSLGRMDNPVQMDQSFTIKNTGNLPSFTYIKVLPKNLVTFTNLKVEPNLFVLLPNEERVIRATYIPNAKDCRMLKQNLHVLPVVDIGKLEIVSGAEVNRFRLRRLNRKCLEKRLAVDPLTKMLAEPIKGEIFSSDFSKFKEYPSAIPDILETVTIKEMLLTIEQDPNQTLVAECPDDSVIFQSLCEQATIVADTTTVSQTSCRLEPPSLVLFSSKPEDSIFLISESNVTLHYEVTCSPKGLSIRPTDGSISPGQTTEFKIKLSKNITDSYFTVRVYVDNDLLEAEVKILNVGSSQRRFLD